MWLQNSNGTSLLKYQVYLKMNWKMYRTEKVIYLIGIIYNGYNPDGI